MISHLIPSFLPLLFRISLRKGHADYGSCRLERLNSEEATEDAKTVRPILKPTRKKRQERRGNRYWEAWRRACPCTKSLRVGVLVPLPSFALAATSISSAVSFTRLFLLAVFLRLAIQIAPEPGIIVYDPHFNSRGPHPNSCRRLTGCGLLRLRVSREGVAGAATNGSFPSDPAELGQSLGPIRYRAGRCSQPGRQPAQG